MPESLELNIAVQSNDAYIAHTAAMLHSLREHNPDHKVSLFFVHDIRLCTKLKDQFEEFCNSLNIPISWLQVTDEQIADLPGWGYIPPVVWYRIFLPALLPIDIEKLLFIDGDVLVLDDLAPLWKTPFSNNELFAAVTNPVPETYAHRAVELGLPGPEKYFNAGIALWNIKAMRATQFTKTMLDYSSIHMEKLIWLEQDAANALYYDQRIELHPRWNCQNGFFYNSWGCGLFAAEDVTSATTKPGMVHFEGGSFAKPWHYLCKHPYRGLYFKHRKKTPWPKVDIDGKTFRNILQRYLPARVYELLIAVRKKLR